jgi:hypothetical protein
MARIRTIKPDFFTHPKIAGCSVPARLLLASLFTQADDEGRLRDQPLLIRALAFGEDDEIDVKALLTELSDKRRIVRYVVDDERFLAVRNFGEHQRISHPTPSKLPPPPDTETPPEASANAPETFRNDSGEIPSGRGREQGKEREGEGEGESAGALRNFALTEADRKCATVRGLDADAQRERFVDHYLAHPKPTADWHAEFREWCRREVRFGRGHPPPRHEPRSRRVAAQVVVPSEPPLTEEQERAIRAKIAGPRYDTAEVAP